MQQILNELTDLLKTDHRLVADGKLLLNKVIELSLQPDAQLLKMLLENHQIKKYFFTQIENIEVFDKVKFHKFVSNKAFLQNSYTSFRNKIGITQENDFLSESKNIVIAWPYKDCILEGGQTKEDSKRNEIFWNEWLAPNQIDRLLHPKCFTGFLRYTSNGECIPEQILPTDNLIIRGNNLLALHSLKAVFAGKIKLIYIDPPYNTGSDSFLYNDNFSHSTWLTFMKNRLEVAWQLLADNGSIFIQTDDTEFAYLKVLCDELFGRDHFRENIILKSSTESGVNAINVKRGERLFKVKENILFYAKSTSFRFTPFYTKTDFNTNYRYEVVKTTEGYTVRDVYKFFIENKLLGRKRKDISEFEMYAIEQEFIAYALNHAENIYSLEKNIKKAGEKFKQFAEENKAKGVVEEFVNSHHETVLIYDGGALVPLRERVIVENGVPYFGVLASDLWVDIGTTPSNEGGISFGNGKKPEKLLRRIIEMTTQPGDWVLDFHLGSGTTAAVAHKLARRYIGIEQMDYGENDATKRLQNVIHGDPTGISKSIQWKGGGQFLYMELKKWNQILVDKILNSNTFEQLSKTLQQIESEAFVSFDVNMHALNEYKTEFESLDFETQKKCAIQLLDLNYLYVPYSETDDADFGISPHERQLNHQFYALKIQ